ncbi:DUF4974 domain-containing protein [Danxiaibacter flavus]|uniref:DUF4974 domain-containing protein n=1 Tax=Danxiaibacter flavus TaxID=3049108 RepID=A0ABV3ZD59_9BACT|nr:DUF4974 domain-containing protein [Chitinophagaceae bacterium DXS]
MSRCLNKEASEEEQEALNALLSEDIDLARQYEMLQQFWQDEQLQHRTEEQDTENKQHENVRRVLYLASLPDESEEVKERSNVHSLFRWKSIKRYVYTAAAACILLFIARIVLVQKQEQNSALNTSQIQTVTTSNGTRTRTILPDGSVVWLNSGSKISYSNDFKGAFREVTLSGEAFFDVVKNPKKPFIIHASNINIKVLGTAFNVRSYESDSTTETTLVRGLIQISNAHQPAGKTVYLHPNEKIVVSKKTESIEPLTVLKNDPASQSATISKIDTAVKIQDRPETAWVYNRLVFRGENFKELATKLERWYNIKIHFTDEAASQLSFNGSFENETIEEAFNALQAAVPFNYKITDHEIFISTAK